MHVFPIEIYRCALGADSCSQSGRSPELVKVAGEPGSSLHRASGQRCQAHECLWKLLQEMNILSMGCKVERWTNCYDMQPPIFSGLHRRSFFSCLSNPSKPVMQEFGDMAASILQLHCPQGRAGKLLLQSKYLHLEGHNSLCSPPRLCCCSPKAP